MSPSRFTTAVRYTMPEESHPHTATWLQCPHEHQYGVTYRNRLEPVWVAMTKALVGSEAVNIVVYDEAAQTRATKQLTAAGVDLSDVHFFRWPTDDVWVRDNGPIYVFDRDGQLTIEDWGFNGWGEKADFENCDQIPSRVAKFQGLPSVSVAKLVNEGGSVEIDGRGTLMATRSSVINANRNPDMSQADIEEVFHEYLGVSNFIWLNGVAGLEITDMHVDGFARFGNAHTIITMSDEDLLDWEVPEGDIETLREAKDIDGVPYDQVLVPLTKHNVVTTYGKDLGFRGSYINYYIGNKVVLVPNYQDPNDKVANATIQKLYPTRKVIGIDVRNLIANGGMVHCVTQQQPAPAP